MAAKAKRETEGESASRSAALHNLPSGEMVATTSHEPTEAGGETEARCSPRWKSDRLIVSKNSSHNLPSQMIKEKLVNLTKRSSSGHKKTVDEKSKIVQGHENKAYLHDDVHVTYSALKVQSLGLLKCVSQPSKELLVPTQEVSFVVLCLSGVGWMDVSAAKQMGAIFMEHENAGISMVLAGANDGVMQVLRQCGVLDMIPEDKLYHSIHDAVTALMADGLHSETQPSPFVRAGACCSTCHAVQLHFQPSK